jgi:hypothetical protein
VKRSFDPQRRSGHEPGVLDHSGRTAGRRGGEQEQEKGAEDGRDRPPGALLLGRSGCLAAGQAPVGEGAHEAVPEEVEDAEVAARLLVVEPVQGLPPPEPAEAVEPRVFQVELHMDIGLEEQREEEGGEHGRRGGPGQQPEGQGREGRDGDQVVGSQVLRLVQVGRAGEDAPVDGVVVEHVPAEETAPLRPVGQASVERGLEEGSEIVRGEGEGDELEELEGHGWAPFGE